jgi:hypothetical protein
MRMCTALFPAARTLQDWAQKPKLRKLRCRRKLLQLSLRAKKLLV